DRKVGGVVLWQRVVRGHAVVVDVRDPVIAGRPHENRHDLFLDVDLVVGIERTVGEERWVVFHLPYGDVVHEVVQRDQVDDLRRVLRRLGEAPRGDVDRDLR